MRERFGACCIPSTGPLQWSWKKRKRTPKETELSMGSFLQGDKEQRRMFKPSTKDPTTGPFAISMQWLQFLLNTGHWKPIFHQSALWGRLSNGIKRETKILSISCWRRQWQPTPVPLPRKSHGQRSLVGCSPWGLGSWTWLSNFTFTFHFHALEKEMATHSSVLAWKIPGMGEPDGLPSMGSHRVGRD